MQLASSLVMLFSVLVPARMWYAPSMPLTVSIKSDQPVTLILTEMTGRPLEFKGSPDVEAGKDVDIKSIFPAAAQPGTYILYAVPRGKTVKECLGTPLVIGVRQERRVDAPQTPLVTRVEPLRYAVLSTESGTMSMAFYYDTAPNTVNSFLTLAQERYYDRLTFHRIVPGFVVQGGDPSGDGTGGPGYQIDAEFSDRKHELGVLSMARQGDPLERQGMRPRPEFANSAGSQFFICLGDAAFLNGGYTAFGKVVDGLDAVKAMGQLPIADPQRGMPEKPPVIKSIEVKPVTAKNNPYLTLFETK